MGDWPNPPPLHYPRTPFANRPIAGPPAYATPNPSLHPNRPAPPMPINFVDGHGYTVNGDGDDVLNPPNLPALAGPPVCTHHSTFVTRSAVGLHAVPVRGGEVILRWGPYQLEVGKDGRTDGDALVHWAIGGTVPPKWLASP